MDASNIIIFNTQLLKKNKESPQKVLLYKQNNFNTDTFDNIFAILDSNIDIFIKYLYMTTYNYIQSLITLINTTIKSYDLYLILTDIIVFYIGDNIYITFIYTKDTTLIYYTIYLHKLGTINSCYMNKSEKSSIYTSKSLNKNIDLPIFIKYKKEKLPDFKLNFTKNNYLIICKFTDDNGHIIDNVSDNYANLTLIAFQYLLNEIVKLYIMSPDINEYLNKYLKYKNKYLKYKKYYINNNEYYNNK
jgi:hypothetical protein